MCESYWWHCYGKFSPWRECPTRPDPGEVLLFYLEKRGIQPDEQIAYLSDLLDLQKSMVYSILKGESLDTISRSRILVKALKIHPPLLGIDAKYYPIERHTYWWRDQGFSFNADAQGYPLISEVIAYLRVNRMQEGERNVKGWSQEDLGDATGLKKETIYRMERDRNPLILENMSRRAIVASALGTLAGDQEPTIYHLLGLDPQAYGVTVPVSESLPAVHFSLQKLTDEMVVDLQQQQSAFITEYMTGHAQDSVWMAREWVHDVKALLPQAGTTAQRVSLLVLQSRQHQFLLNIAREQLNTHLVRFHGDEAVKLAEDAASLPDVGDYTLLDMSSELLAVALYRRANALDGLGQSGLAQTDIDRALLLPVRSGYVRDQVQLDAGVIHAHTARNWKDKQEVLSYFDRAARSIHLYRPGDPDAHFTRCGKTSLSLYKARALLSPRMKGATGENVRDFLQQAQRLVDPALVRRQVVIEVFQAQAHFLAGNYQEATETAVDALEKSRLVRSQLNKRRIEELYGKLLNTSFKGKPCLSYLGVKLRTWCYGM